jgi:hypothetical protein
MPAQNPPRTQAAGCMVGPGPSPPPPPPRTRRLELCEGERGRDRRWRVQAAVAALCGVAGRRGPDHEAAGRVVEGQGEAAGIADALGHGGTARRGGCQQRAAWGFAVTGRMCAPLCALLPHARHGHPQRACGYQTSHSPWWPPAAPAVAASRNVFTATSKQPGAARLLLAISPSTTSCGSCA